MTEAIELTEDGVITQHAERARLSSKAITFALIANSILALLKTMVGIFAHSSALLADGINSSSDVVYNLAVSFFIRAARKPADEEHPYGHSQYESVGALVVAAFIVTAAFTIFWNSIQSLVDLLQGRSEVAASGNIAFYVALFTVILKAFLFFYTRILGEKTNNPTVKAVALDHRNDILSATAVVVGTLMARLGYAWADPLAGAIVAIFFLSSGITILLDSTDILMDTIPGTQLNKKVRESLADIPGLEGIGEIQAHRFGQYLVINMTIFVCGDISVNEGDLIADHVEERLINEIPFLQAVHVHYHSQPGS